MNKRSISETKWRIWRAIKTSGHAEGYRLDQIPSDKVFTEILGDVMGKEGPNMIMRILVGCGKGEELIPEYDEQVSSGVDINLRLDQLEKMVNMMAQAMNGGK